MRCHTGTPALLIGNRSHGKILLQRGNSGIKSSLGDRIYINFLIITDLGEAESESIPLKIRYDQIFFYDPTQRHGDHREKQSL